VVWDITPCSPMEVNRHFGEEAAMLVSCLPYSLLLKMEEMFSSEMLGDFRRTTRRYIPRDRKLYNLSVSVRIILFYE
jgi:hypothetical protein